MSFDPNIDPGAPVAMVAHAKINLALHITGQRDDGYHLLDSLVVFTDFGDRLTIESAGDGPDPVSLEISGRFAAELLTGDGKALANNLVTRAAKALAEIYHKSGISCSNVRIILEKNMPVASGIGGGSADAAAVLVLLQKIWSGDFTPDLFSIAAKLGADVPMCLDPQPKRVRGTGEQLSEFSLPVSLPILLVNPQIPLSTPSVFGALTNKTNLPVPTINNTELGGFSHSRGFVESALLENAVEMLLPLRNDLQIPAMSLVPDIQDVLSSLQHQSGCLLARMSGSGATCFGIFSTPKLADNALIGIREHHPEWWSVACVTLPASTPRPQ